MTENIRRAVHDAIHENPAHLSAKALAERMGINLSSLHRYGEEGGEIPLVRLIQLVKISEDIRPVLALCQLFGGSFMPIGRARQIDKADIRAIREFGEFLHVRAAALSDGKITADELSKILKEGAESITAIAAVMNDAEHSWRQK